MLEQLHISIIKFTVLNNIKETFHSENGKIGYRMIKLLLEKEKINLSLLTVHKYMKELSLKSVALKKKPSLCKGYSTQSI